MYGPWRNLPANSKAFFCLTIFGTLLSAALSARAEAYYRFDKPPSLYVGAGFLFQNTFGDVSASTSGSPSVLGNALPQVGISSRLGLGSWFFVPSASITPFGGTDSDLGSTLRVYTFGLAAEKWLGELALRFGPGLMLRSHTGNGGSVTLNNGGGFQTFFHPGDSATSQLTYLQVGTGLELGWDGVRADMDAIVTGLMSSRRATHLAFTISYGFM